MTDIVTQTNQLNDLYPGQEGVPALIDDALDIFSIEEDGAALAIEYYEENTVGVVVTPEHAEALGRIEFFHDKLIELNEPTTSFAAYGYENNGGDYSGMLVITEIMTNPRDEDGDLDSSLQWIEVYNTADVALNYQTLEVLVGDQAWQLSPNEELVINPGEYLVLTGDPGLADTIEKPVGVLEPKNHSNDLVLDPALGEITLQSGGSDIIDELAYNVDEIGPLEENTSFSLDPDLVAMYEQGVISASELATSNDAMSDWANSTTDYPPSEARDVTIIGTPGEENIII